MDGPTILFSALLVIAAGFGALAALSLYNNARQRDLRRAAHAAIGRETDDVAP